MTNQESRLPHRMKDSKLWLTPDKEAIYGLVDSREPCRFRYVGRTACPAFRLQQHRHGLPTSWKMRSWRQGVKKDGARVEMVILQIVPSDPGLRARAENRWIDAMRRRGQADLNGTGAARVYKKSTSRAAA